MTTQSTTTDTATERAEATTTRATMHPWSDSFTVCNPPSGAGPAHCSGEIRLRQKSATQFVLDSQITYHGDYRHADGRELDQDWRTVGPDFETDLASIPSVMRWMVNSYGAHTPAALIHDKLIPDHPIPGNHQAEVEADRFFRHMLAEVGVPFVTRWVMWAGVALRTKAHNGWVHRTTLVLWGLCALIGLVLMGISIAMWSPVWIAASFLPMIPATAGWGRQWGVGLVGAVALPFIVPAVVPIVAAIVAGRVLNIFAEPARTSRTMRTRVVEAA